MNCRELSDSFVNTHSTDFPWGFFVFRFGKKHFTWLAGLILLTIKPLKSVVCYGLVLFWRQSLFFFFTLLSCVSIPPDWSVTTSH